MKQIMMVLAVFSLMIGMVNAQEITVVTEEMSPYNYTENGEIVGIATEIVKATLDKAGVSATFEIFPWVRSYKMATEQANVLIYCIGRNEKREALFKWIGPIVPPLSTGLYTLKTRTDVVVKSLDDAKKYKTAVARASAPYQMLIEQGFEEKKQLELMDNIEQSFKMIEHQRIDLVAGSEVAMMFMKGEKRGFSAEEIQEVLTLSKIDLFMAFSKDTPDELVARVNNAFEEVKASGLIDATWEKYLKKLQ